MDISVNEAQYGDDGQYADGDQHYAEGEEQQYAEGEEQYAEGEEQYAEGEEQQYAEGEEQQYAEGEEQQYAEGEEQQYAEGEEQQYAEGEEQQYAEGEYAEGEYAEGEAVDVENQLSDTLDFLTAHDKSASALVEEMRKLRDAANQMSTAFGGVSQAFRKYTAEMNSDVSDERLVTLKKATEAGMQFAQNMQREYMSAAMNIEHFSREPLAGLVTNTIPYARHAAFLYKTDAGKLKDEDKAADAKALEASSSIADDDEAALAAAASGEESLFDRALNFSAEAFETACSMPSQIVPNLLDAMKTLSTESVKFCDETMSKVQPENEFAMAEEATYEEAEEDEEVGDAVGDAEEESSTLQPETGDEDLHPEVPCGELVDMEDEHYKLLLALHSLNDDLLADRIHGVSMAPHEIQRLFCNSAELLRIHEEFVPALHEALSETFYPAAIVALYKKFYARFERAYLIYIENDPLARFALVKVKDNESFKRASQSKINELSIAGHPVSSFYQLLSEPHDYMKRQQEHLGALLRQTSVSDSVHKDITLLLDQYMTMPKVDNNWEQMKKLIDVEKTLVNERVVRRGRRILCKGTLAVSGVSPAQITGKDVEVNQDANITLPEHVPKFKRKGKLADTGLTVGGEYRCILFNDEIWFAMLVPVPKKSKEKTETDALYKVVQKWNVLSIIPRHAPPMKSGAAAFFLHTPDGLFSFEILKSYYSASPTLTPITVCETWMTRIENVIKDRHTTRVFGIPIESVAENGKNLINGVPAFISEAADFIEQEGLDEEGIFRQSAAASVIGDLLSEIDSGSVPRYSEVHAAANIIKKWLRDLPERLLVDAMVDKWEGADEDPDKLRALVMELPPCNRATFVKLMHLFKLVVEHQERNLMSSNNLGIVVGVNMLPSSKVGAQCFECMLRNYDAIFNKDLLSFTSSMRSSRRHRKSKAKSHHKHKTDL